MDSLIGGHFGRFFDDQPLMGSFRSWLELRLRSWPR